MQIVRGGGIIARMKIHLFLLGLGVAWFVGCSAEPPGPMAAGLPDEEIIELSVAEAFGEGDMFGDEGHGHHFGGPDAVKGEAVEPDPESIDPREKGVLSAKLAPRTERLKELTIWRRGLGNVSGLAQWKALKVLYLADNEIRDVRPLTKLLDLEELYLDRNPVIDVSALADCKKLKLLSLRGTPAAEGPGVAKLRAALPNCEIILK